MYTSQVVIYDTASFEVLSYGNGAAYKFTDKVTEKKCYFDGDDASSFREEIERWENAREDLSSEQILANIWSYYEEVSI
jgi:hypothetical protein